MCPEPKVPSGEDIDDDYSEYSPHYYNSNTSVEDLEDRINDLESEITDIRSRMVTWGGLCFVAICILVGYF